MPFSPKLFINSIKEAMELTRINVLLIDNYDSFTYNIAHYLRKYPIVKLQIVEANKVRLDNIASFDKIIFSPGPDIPRPGNVMESVLLNYSQTNLSSGSASVSRLFIFFLAAGLDNWVKSYMEARK
jgi:hypothetical protein